MTPYHWPDASATNTPSSAASFGFDVAAELARINHPTARAVPVPEMVEITHFGEPSTFVRADLLSRVLPQDENVEVGRFPTPSSAVGLGVSSRLTRRRLSAGHWILLLVGLLLGRITRH